MRKDGHSPGCCHQFDGVLERSVVLGNVVSPATGQQVGEGLADARHHSRSHQGRCDVRASDRRTGVGQDLIGIDGQTVTSHHRRHHPDTFDAFGAQSLTFFCEFGVRRIEEVCQQMNSHRPTTFTSPLTRHLHPANQADPARQGLRRLGPARSRVVIGDGDDVESGVGCGAHEGSRGIGAVRCVGVGVKVYSHCSSVSAIGNFIALR
jgi:hypothetical protein